MALDIHLSSNEKEAPYKNPSASFEEQAHELIFDRFGVSEGKFPLFRRMEDFYKDTKYRNGELHILIGEIEEIKKIYVKNTYLIIQLNSILAACKKAQKKEIKGSERK